MNAVRAKRQRKPLSPVKVLANSAKNILKNSPLRKQKILTDFNDTPSPERDQKNTLSPRSSAAGAIRALNLNTPKTTPSFYKAKPSNATPIRVNVSKITPRTPSTCTVFFLKNLKKI